MPEQRGSVGAVRDEVAFAVQQRLQLDLQCEVSVGLADALKLLELKHAAICNDARAGTRRDFFQPSFTLQPSANACRRFSAIPAPRARAVGQHGENLRRVARQIHRVGGKTKSHGLAIGGTETSHGVLATRTRAESDAGGASVLASRTWRRKAKRRLARSLAPPKSAAPFKW